MGKKINLTEMHSIMLDMMSAIHDFCVNNDIKYSLGGGSLLGAVRHKGFIPWDDDMDIMMPRDDYEKFIRCFNGKNPYYECIQFVDNENVCYCDTFAKVHDVRTLCNEKRGNRFKYGINIDIFPIDGFPRGEMKTRIFLKICHIFRRLLLVNYECGHAKTFNDYLFRFLSMLFPQKYIYHLATNILITFDYKKSEYAGALTGRYGIKERYKKEIFDKYISLDFESKNFMCIKDYDAYLTQHYGDYMVIPPIEKQVTHSSNPEWV
ncbi:MAG: LicD family protein [Paludibacteraceae bacterium]|nr:LicD family protein [Paludibacteraceae bacterium]